MSKNFFKDMIKIKNENRERMKQKVSDPVSHLPDSDHVPTEHNFTSQSEPFVENKFASVYDLAERSDNTKKSKRRLWVVAVLCFLIFIYSISLIFSKVVITINPKIQDVTLNETFSATKNRGEGELAFDLIVVSGEEEKIVQGSEEKDVSKKAEGVVLIYNNFSSKTQRLDIDTRLEGSNGKIYKTKKALVVPGMKGSAPGSVEVGIYAAEAGEAYNSDPLDFKIFGFKGTPKYSKFYARSKSSITGGFVGKASIISDTEKLKTIKDLETILQAKLSKKVTDQVPKGFVLFKNASFLDIDEDINSTSYKASEDNTLSIKVKGALYGLLFNEEKLTKKIVEDKIPEYDGEVVYIQNIQNLIFSISNKDDASFGNIQNIDFNLSGSAKIVWKLDEEKLAKDLLGKSKKDFSQVLLQYPNVDSADLVISPFWKMSLPNKVKDIKVIVNYPE